MVTEEKPKPVDGLMRYLRDKKHIDINGSNQKRKLRNVGYYHGYKGYRFFNRPHNGFDFVDFNQVIAINDFDRKLKATLYPHIMFIETALKNYVLEIILKETKSNRFVDVYSKILVSYKDFRKFSQNYKDHMRKRLQIRDRVYGMLSRNLTKKQVVKHFYNRDKPVPIWAIFEMINLGDFGNFVTCIRKDTRKLISESLELNSVYDTNFEMTQDIIFAIKDLRNAIAHNEPVYDVRFRGGNIPLSLINCINNDVGTTVNFKTVYDYFILVAYILDKLHVDKREINKMLSNFDEASKTLSTELHDNSIYFKIVNTNTVQKSQCIKRFISKS